LTWKRSQVRVLYRPLQAGSLGVMPDQGCRGSSHQTPWVEKMKATDILSAVNVTDAIAGSLTTQCLQPTCLRVEAMLRHRDRRPGDLRVGFGVGSGRRICREVHRRQDNTTMQRPAQAHGRPDGRIRSISSGIKHSLWSLELIFQYG
jgi:hypothetical protein